MSLTTGTRLGPYEILSAIGAGGMGEVYKARDTRLDRTVAIKILPDTLAADPQFRERFDREARTISKLTHPHICTLYDVGDQNGTAFLVMEYLEGETLADRLARDGNGTAQAALAPKEALRIAIEICDALDNAHRAGIVHRDLKPANVMLTKAGAKLLDFGLAKSAAPAIATTALSMLPTTPPNLTMQGMILGTFQYMAPEQIEGLEADARTDIFAFGALLFEMLTGRRAFEGKTRASLLGAILKDEPPPVSRVQPVVPAVLDRIISTCLAKEPDDRYQSARDLWRDLQWAASGSSDGAAVRTVNAPRPSNRIAWLVAGVVSVLLIAMAVVGFRLAGEVAPDASPVEFTIASPDGTSFGGPPPGGGTGVATQVAVSPNGRNIAFVAGARPGYQLWLRSVASVAATPIPGTEGATFPFWSPDSRFIAFFAGGKLKKVQMAGGPPTELCDAPGGRGGTWSRDNVILFAPAFGGAGLQRVSSNGGTPTAVTADPAGSEGYRWPHFLPDGRHYLYTVITGSCCPASKPATIRIGSLDQDEATVTLLQAESSVSYASGHLLFAAAGTLMAQPFDAKARVLNGDAFPVAENIDPEGSRYVSASVSNNGTLVYARGGSLLSELTWFDRAGRSVATLGEPAYYTNLALSPDGSHVAVSKRTGSPENQDIWIIDIARNIPSRLTDDAGGDGGPVWSPDGSRIAFQRTGKISMRQQVVTLAAADESLIVGADTTAGIMPTDWSRDGRFIAYTLTTGRFPPRLDVLVLPLFGDRKPIPLAETAFLEGSGVFSPDGRWVGYVSNEADQANVYVRPFLRDGGKVPISRDGGSHPVWRADGKELFYLAEDGSFMAVPIDTTNEVRAGVPQVLFPVHLGAGALSSNNTGQVYAVRKDGQQILINSRPEKYTQSPLTVVLNWTATIHK
jgi:Tol biopolymer transport system component/predicted Ser/Thr protein kinase